MRVGVTFFECRYFETLVYAQSLGQPVFVVGFGAKIFTSNDLARDLVIGHPAFLNSTKTLILANHKRNRDMQRSINTSIINRSIRYLRIDNGCDEDSVTGLISPLTNQDTCGMRKETQLAFVRILTHITEPPLLQPLRTSHGLTPRQIDILKPFCNDYSIQNAGIAIGVTQQRAREVFCEIYARLGVAGKNDLIAFLGDLPRDPNS